MAQVVVEDERVKTKPVGRHRRCREDRNRRQPFRQVVMHGDPGEPNRFSQARPRDEGSAVDDAADTDQELERPRHRHPAAPRLGPSTPAELGGVTAGLLRAR